MDSLIFEYFDHKRFHRLRSLEGRLVASHRGHICQMLVSSDICDEFDFVLGFSPYGFED